jgi:hypothetical protein
MDLLYLVAIYGKPPNLFHMHFHVAGHTSQLFVECNFLTLKTPPNLCCRHDHLLHANPCTFWQHLLSLPSPFFQKELIPRIQHSLFILIETQHHICNTYTTQIHLLPLHNSIHFHSLQTFTNPSNKFKSQVGETESSQIHKTQVLHNDVRPCCKCPSWKAKKK